MSNLRGIGSGASFPEPNKTPGVALSILMLFVFLGVVFGCAAAGGAVTTANIDTWYAGIAKPELTPANWVFPIVWNFLFFLIGIAGWLAWRAAGSLNAAGAALALFAAQLMLNFAWSVLFFGLHSPGLAVFEIFALDATVAATAFVFWPLSRLAALLLLPYLAWSLFATYLTIAVWLLNR
ncbi:MAG TPA: TspO/MBR family protein [Parvibaculum sp.]|jgi:tryptophan-rich sensory protein